jgi:urate oxidase
MTATLGTNRYGKSRIRLVKVRRERDPHEIVDLTVDVQLEGAFDPMYTDGDNTACVATDTMKNTVYAFARGDRLDCIERFALRLAEHFLAQPAVARARVAIEEQPWSRLAAGGAPHPHAFMREGAGAWTAAVTRAPEKTEVVSGLADVVLLKTTDSAFAGFPRDRFTTLAETADRILATSMTASWTYASVDSDFGARERIRAALLETFAAHQSRSVQHTLYAMGEAALAASDAISDVTLTLPNRHHLLVDLRPFGLDNPNEVFVATDEPYGLIHATVRRT